MTFGAYAAATLLGIAPRAFAYTALGGSLGDLDSPRAGGGGRRRRREEPA